MTEQNLTKQPEVFIKMVLDAWHSKTGQLDKLLSELSDEQLLKEVSPGRNRGIYLLGHLTALADSIFPLLGYEKLAEHLFQPFVLTPDKQTDVIPGIQDVKQDWTKVTTALAKKMATISPDEWFQKHTAVTAEDYEKEPHRNKLNVVLSRVSHVDYHLGQLQFLKPKP